MSDPFVEQLAHLARTHPTANKWVLVPHHELGWMLGERLLLSGCNWINLRFITPFQLALDAAAPELLAQGLNPCPEGLGPALVHRLLIESANHRFASIIDLPGTAEGLWGTLRECRMAGVALDDLEESYQAYLDARGLVDRSQVFRQPGQSKVEPDDFVVLYPYYVWPPLVRQFVDRLPGIHCTPAATDVPAPRRYQGRRQPTQSVVNTPLEFFSAGRRDLEFQEVLRRIDGPYDQVEIVAHREDLPLLADMLVQFDCPATFSQGLPMALSRPGQALLGFLSWFQRGLPGFLVRELLMGNLLKAPPNSWTSARLIRAARIGWGRADYRPRLEALAKRSSRHEKLSIQAQQALALAEWFDQLFAEFPERSGNLTPAKVWLESLQKMVDQHLDHDPEATPGLLAALEEMKQLPGEEWPRGQLLHLIRERVQNLVWNARRPAPGHLHVTRLDQMGLSGRPVLFLTGQEEVREANFPIEDCFLSDQERQRLHPDLALSTDIVEERKFAVDERLATLTGKVTWSYSVRDRRGEQELLPSWRLFEAARSTNAGLQTYAHLLEWLGEPVQPWLAEEAQDFVGTVGSVVEQYPDLGQGLEAERQRSSAEFTVYDGWVPSAAGLWDPRTHDVALSVSRLQGLAACPYSFFLGQGLGIFPEPLPLPDPDAWLDAATRGHILHQVFALYGRALRDQQSSFDFVAALEEALAEQLPPPSAWVEARERETLDQHLQYFLALEQGRVDRIPLGLEVGFGLGEEEEPLSQTQPVTLDLGSGMVFQLQGRIDRLDRVPQGYCVVDYKTGRPYQEKRSGPYDRGRHLQHALYALAAQQLLGQEAVRSEYYFTHPQATSPWLEYPPPERELLRQVLELVIQPLADGAFVHSDDQANDCRFCSFRDACTSHQDGPVRAKLNSPQLRARRQLLEEA